MNIKKTANRIEGKSATSAFARGVIAYAIELLEDLKEREDGSNFSKSTLKKDLLNGAKDWQQYSSGGCSLVADYYIAERLLTAKQFENLTRADGSIRNPWGEEWIDTQARALSRAYALICWNFED